MKKILLMIMLVLSTFLLGEGYEKNFGESITDKIKFGMTKEEFKKVIQKKELSISHDEGSSAVYYYSEVVNPLGKVSQVASFGFRDNRLVSAIFDSATTDEEHKQTVKTYSKNQNKFSKEKMKKIEKEGSLLLYNSKKTIEVYRMLDHTFVVVQLATPENVENKINMINN